MQSFNNLSANTSNLPPGTQRRIVLCFDGTGNRFQGDESDTNVVKLFQMLDRNNPNQFHYYQPGIGTYDEKELSKSQGMLSKIASNLSAAVDQAIGTSFVDHLVAGYRFLMRYCLPNDLIYIFGFSRGAYTARFLAEMLHTIGLLSQGNEEMIPLAWRTFSSFQKTRGDESKSEMVREHERFMVNFKQTFCRPGINVHFLGLFDCVNSVSQFEIPWTQKSYTYIPRPPATHVRHAVSIHERRLKFRPALFMMDQRALPENTTEMWFAGNHADVGGGWVSEGKNTLLSDTPLAWMVDEILSLPDQKTKLTFRGNAKHLHNSQQREAHESKQQILSRGLETSRNRNSSELHDMLSFAGGGSWLAVILWWILEILPIFTRLELENGRWIPRHWPPNLGSSRDIPHGAHIHPSVYRLHRSGILKTDQLPHTGGGSETAKINTTRASYAWQSNAAADEGNHDVGKFKSGVGGWSFRFRRWRGGLLGSESREVSSILSNALANGAAKL